MCSGVCSTLGRLISGRRVSANPWKSIRSMLPGDICSTWICMWMNENRAHVLYLKKPYQYGFMRDRYFTGAGMRVSLEYAVLQHGKVVSRRTLIEGSAEEEYPAGKENLNLWSGRLHALPDGSLGVIFSGAWKEKEGREKTGMFLSRLSESGKVEKNDGTAGLKNPYRFVFHKHAAQWFRCWKAPGYRRRGFRWQEL